MKNRKLVEVEKDELILDKGKTGKFRVVADFKGGKTHADGGEPAVVKQGDVIIPAKKRDVVVTALHKGDHKKVEQVRKKLPKDKPNPDAEYKLGTNQIMSITGDATPAISNLIGAVASKPAVTKLQRVKAPAMQDVSDYSGLVSELKNQAQQTAQAIQQSGGTGSQNRNALIRAQLGTQRALSDVATRDVHDAKEMQNQNAMLDFQAQQSNIGQSNLETELNQRAIANKRAAIQQGVADVGQVLSNTGNQLQKQSNEDELRKSMGSYVAMVNPTMQQGSTATAPKYTPDMFKDLTAEPDENQRYANVGIKPSQDLDLSKFDYDVTPLIEVMMPKRKTLPTKRKK